MERVAALFEANRLGALLVNRILVRVVPTGWLRAGAPSRDNNNKHLFYTLF
jgi:hypothetical protein